MTLKSIVVLLVASVGLVACGGNGKLTPNEFEVVSRAPLVVPPEAELAPPRPGEPRAQEINPGRQAYEALFPKKKITKQPPKSKAEIDLLRRMASAGADVRSVSGGPNDKTVVKKTLILAELLDADERQYRPDNVAITRVSSGGK